MLLCIYFPYKARFDLMVTANNSHCFATYTCHTHVLSYAYHMTCTSYVSFVSLLPLSRALCAGSAIVGSQAEAALQAARGDGQTQRSEARSLLY